MRRVLVVIVLLSAATTAAARTDGGRVTLQRTDFHEFGFRLDAGWNVTYNWTTDHAIYFDLHRHRGSEIVPHRQIDGSRGSNGSFQAPERDTFYLYWEAPSNATASLTWRIEGRYLLKDEAFEEPTPIPVRGTVAALAALVVAGLVARSRR